MIEDRDQSEYISLQEATKYCPYTQEYLSLRARQGRLRAKKFGRNWVTKKTWLEDYLRVAEDYKLQTELKKLTVPIIQFAEEPLPVERPTPIEKPSPIGPPVFLPPPKSYPRRLRFSFVLALIFVLLLGGLIFGKVGFKNSFGIVVYNVEKLNQSFTTTSKEVFNYNSQIFKEYAQWMSRQISTVFQSFANSVKKIPQTIVKLFQRQKEVVERPTPEEAQAVMQEIEKLKKQIADLEEKGIVVREITKEISRITQIEPVKEITYEKIISRIDEGALQNLNVQIADLQTDLANRLYAPGGVINQQIYITEPVASPKIYQENGDIVLQAAGSGNVILSAATGMQISGSQVVIDSTSLTEPLIYLADKTRINGDTEIQGTASVGAFKMPTGATAGYVLTTDDSGLATWQSPAGGSASTNWVISGTSMYATDTITTVGIGTTSPAFGLELMSSSTDGYFAVSGSTQGDVLVIDADGNVGIGTTSPAYILDVYGDIHIASSSGGIVFNDGTIQTTAAVGGGDTSSWVISSGLMYATDTVSQLLIGGTVTTTADSILEVIGTSTFGAFTIDNLGNASTSGNFILTGSFDYATITDASITAWNLAADTSAASSSNWDWAADYLLASSSYIDIVNASNTNWSWAADYLIASSTRIESAVNSAFNWILSGNLLYATDTATLIGIGTTSPAYGLEVMASSTAGYFGVSSSTQGDVFVIDANGNVGIGTTNPTGLLTLTGTPASANGLQNLTMTAPNNSGSYYGLNIALNDTGSVQNTDYGIIINMTGITNSNNSTEESGVRVTNLNTTGTQSYSYGFRFDGSAVTANSILYGYFSGNDTGDPTATQYNFYANMNTPLGNNNYGYYTAAPTRTGATSETVYGSYSNLTTYSGASDAAYGFYTLTNSNSTGGAQYAYYANMSSGIATKYGLYLTGEAINYLSGAVGIGTTSPAYGLEVMASSTLGYFGVSSSTQGDVFVIDANGNVGIGTTSPVALLDIAGAGANTDFRISRSENSSAYLSISSQSGNYNSANFGVGGTDALTLQLDAGVAMGTYAGGSTDAPANTLIISGNVGVGTTSPTQKLEIAGSDPAIRISDTTGGASTRDWLLWVTPFSTDGQFAILESTEGGGGSTLDARLLIDTNGNIGIGTTSPAYGLELMSSSTLGYFAISSSTQGDVMRVNANGKFLFDGTGSLIPNAGNATTDAQCLIYEQDTDTLNWGSCVTGGTGLDTWLISGTTMYSTNTVTTLGIGTTSPAYGLEVMSSSTNGYFAISSSTQGEVMVVDANGNVGIGTDTPQALLEIVGVHAQILQRWTLTVNDPGKYLDLSYDGNLNTFIFGSASGRNVAFNNDGYFGIGTTSPAFGLELMSSSTDGYFAVSGSTQGDVFKIDANGYITTGVWKGTPLTVNYLSYGNATTDAQCLTYNEAGDTLNWATCGTGSGSNPNDWVVGSGLGYATTNAAQWVIGGTATATADSILEIIGTTSLGAFTIDNGGNASTSGNFILTGSFDYASITNASITAWNLAADTVNASGTSATGWDYAVGYLNGSSSYIDIVAASNTNWTLTSNIVNSSGTSATGWDYAVGYLNSTSTKLESAIIPSNYWVSPSSTAMYATDTFTLLSIGTTSPTLLFEVATATSIFAINGDTGRVGIGTTSPTQLLEVVGESSGADWANEPGIAARIVNTTTTSYNSAYLDIAANDYTGIRFLGSDLSNFGSIGYESNDGVLSFNYYESSNDLVLATSSGGSTAYVGIGTTTPKALLHLENDNAQILTFDSNVGISASRPAWAFGASGSEFQIDSTANYTDYTNTFTINSNGLVGIGTTSPAYGLEVMASSTDGYFAISSSTQGEVMVVDANGNVGIGTTSPNTLLYIYGDNEQLRVYGTTRGIIRLNSDAAAWQIENNTNDGNFPAGAFGIRESSPTAGNWFTILSGGNIGIGTTSPEKMLEVVATSSGASYAAEPGVVGRIINTERDAYNSAYLDVAADDYSGIRFLGGGLNVWGSIGINSNDNIMSFDWYDDGADMVIATSGAANAFVGIGTTTPEYLLHLYTETAANNYITIENGTDTQWGEAGFHIKTPQNQWYIYGDDYTNNDVPDSALGFWSNDLGGIAMTLMGNGNVGIGSTTPGYLLSVGSTNATSTVLVGVHGAARFAGAVTSDAGGADIAESYPINPICHENNDCPEAGDLVSVNENQIIASGTLDISSTLVIDKSQVSYDPKLIGAISEDAGFVLSAGLDETSSRQVALAGRVPIKISLENGPIAIGDLLTSASSTPGAAMKATEPGRVIGVALESFNENDEDGKVLVFVNPHWYGGQLSANGLLLANNDNEQVTEGGSLLADFVQKVKGALASLGLWVENGIAKVRELFVDKLFAQKARIEKLEMVDKATGEIYCTWIENGEWVKTKGECDAASVEQPSESPTEPPVESPPNEPLPTENPAETPPEEILPDEPSEPPAETPAEHPTEPAQTEQPVAEQPSAPPEIAAPTEAPVETAPPAETTAPAETQASIISP